jgi:hypothetical protein
MFTGVFSIQMVLQPGTVAHACNPSYLGGRDQKDHGSKPAQANSSQDPISKKKKITKNGGGGVAQGVGPEFKPQYHIKKHGPTKKNVLHLIMNKEP